MSSRLLKSDNAILLIVDIQEKLLPAIPEAKRLTERTRLLLQACDQLGTPIVVSEQYPAGLGRTISALSQHLPLEAAVFEKMSFGCGDKADLQAFLNSLSRTQILICGIETHVCVNQSVHQLLRAGYEVHLMQDAMAARREDDHAAGLAKMQQSGAVPGSVETAIFELLETADHPQFKAIQTLIKNSSTLPQPALHSSGKPDTRS